MKTVLREFPVRSDDGDELMMCEVLIENDTTGHRNVGTRSSYRKRSFQERDGDMRARTAEQIEPGVFQFKDGQIVREVK